MDRPNVSFWRRGAAGLIDLSLGIAVLAVWGMVWLYSEIGLCDCATAESLDDYLAAGSYAIRGMDPSLALVPFVLYAIWSWTPLSGRRSVGMRIMGIRVVRA